MLSNLRGPLGVYVDPLFTVNASRNQHNVFAEVWDSPWFDVGKFTLKEAIYWHVLVRRLSVYDIARTSVLIAHQSISLNHQLLAGRPHLP